MSGIQNMMNLGKGALMAHQRRMATHQNNITNANTVGYRRERTELEALGAATLGGGQGVRAGAVSSVSAPLVDRVIPEQRGLAQHHQTVAQAGQALEMLSDSDDLQGKLGTFFQSARALEVDGNDPTARRQFVNDAQSFATTLSQRRELLSSQRAQGEQLASDKVSALNSSLDELQTLEQQVMQAGPNVAPELVDARDELVNTIADLTGARVVPDNKGRVNLVTSSGAALFEGGRARHVQLVDGGPQGGFSYATEKGRALDGLSGELGGLKEADTELYGASIDRLDAFADRFASEANAVHAKGTGLDGVSGRPLFTQPAGKGAVGFQVSEELRDDPDKLALSASAAGLPGDASNARELADLSQKPLSGAFTAQGMLAQDSSKIGSHVRQAQSSASMALGALQQAEALQSSISGVSLEEEMVSMAQAQRAYEASIKLMKTADELMETVLSLK